MGSRYSCRASSSKRKLTDELVFELVFAPRPKPHPHRPFFLASLDCSKTFFRELCPCTLTFWIVTIENLSQFLTFCFGQSRQILEDFRQAHRSQCTSKNLPRH